MSAVLAMVEHWRGFLMKKTIELPILVRQQRLTLGISQAELANAIGVTQCAISRVEAGRLESLSVRHLFALCTKLMIDLTAPCTYEVMFGSSKVTRLSSLLHRVRRRLDDYGYFRRWSFLPRTVWWLDKRKHEDTYVHKLDTHVFASLLVKMFAGRLYFPGEDRVYKLFTLFLCKTP
jgi:transcriptional regulator with XRE-family HTH domain